MSTIQSSYFQKQEDFDDATGISGALVGFSILLI
jgi:hypothetical protein